MPLAPWFWIILFLYLLSGGYWAYGEPAGRWPRLGAFLLPFLALVVLGLAQFGGPVK